MWTPSWRQLCAAASISGSEELSAAFVASNTALKAYVKEELDKVVEKQAESTATLKYLATKNECTEHGLSFNVADVACCEAGELYSTDGEKCLANYGATKQVPGGSCKDILDQKGPRTDDDLHVL